MNLKLNDDSLHAVFCLSLGLPPAATQTTVAEKLGIQQTLYSRLVRGNRISAPQLARRLRQVGAGDLADAVDRAHAAHVDATKRAAEAAAGVLASNINDRVAEALATLVGAPPGSQARVERPN